MSRSISRNPRHSKLCGVCGYFPAILLGIAHWNPEYIFTKLPGNIRQSVRSSVSLDKQNVPAPLHDMRGMELLPNHQLLLWRRWICFNESNTLQFCGFQRNSFRAELQFVANQCQNLLVLQPGECSSHLVHWHTELSGDHSLKVSRTRVWKQHFLNLQLEIGSNL